MHSREIREILDTCRPLRSNRALVFLRPGTGRLAVVAGKRIGGAVQRNRARRVLRAAWAEVSPLVADRDAVLVARDTIVGADARGLVGELSEVMSGASGG